ncbi:hypothetical protein HDV01_001934, partial [Terramyces sp. JEL0728]
ATVNDYLYCALLSIPWIAIQAIWQTEFGTVKDTMIHYGLNPDAAGLIWMFGPITGFFTAPLVGAYSDACTSKFGRRRPFIVGGLLLTIVFSLCFAAAEYVKGYQVFLGYISFVMLDITINVMQTPVRALASDLAPAHMQSTVQLMAAGFQGLGSIIGFYIQKALGADATLLSLFSIVMAINFIVISGVCFLIKEPQHVPKENVEISFTAPFTTVIKNVFAMDAKMAVVCAVEFCSWWALFFWWTDSSTWWKLNVYGGCITVSGNDGPDSACPKGSAGDLAAQSGGSDYDSTGIYANTIQTLLSIALGSLVLFGLLKKVKYIYSLGLALGGVLLILLKFGPKSVGFAWLVTLAMPVAISVIQAFPFAIVGSYNKGNDGQDTGVQMGLLNLFICLPQFLVTIITNGVQISDTTGLFISGLALCLGAVFALFITEVDLDSSSPDVEGKTKA